MPRKSIISLIAIVTLCIVGFASANTTGSEAPEQFELARQVCENDSHCDDVGFVCKADGACAPTS